MQTVYLSFGIEARFNTASSIVCGSTLTFLAGTFPFTLVSAYFRLIILEMGSLSSSSSEADERTTGCGTGGTCDICLGVEDRSVRSGSGGV